ncbi:MAG: response regulator transcription factor [Gammaproteobacteria bacterium]
MDLDGLRILIIDDHQLLLQGLERLLHDANAQVQISADAQDVLKRLPEMSPDLILIDLFMPGLDGLGFIQAVSARQLLIPIAVISSTDDLQKIRQVLETGAFGFIPKSYNREELLLAIGRILQGEVYVPEDVRNRLAFLSARAVPQQHGLSDRQVQIVKLLSRGHPNKRISNILNISEETVKTHLRNIYKLLGVSTRTEAVAKAVDLDILST